MDLQDGETTQMQGSGKTPYTLKNVGGVFSCSCPAWRNQSHPINQRTCKHLRKLRGDAVEDARIGNGSAVVAKATVGKESSVVAKASVCVPPLLLAHKWDGVQNITGWWMSEKLDGIRAYWNGSRFISRLGNAFHVPEWFCKGLPNYCLDGELWIGRKQFQRTSGFVRRQDMSDNWKEVRYLIFDKPDAELPFESRIQLLERVIDVPYASVVKHERCKGIVHLKESLAKLESEGAEGLMLRQPGSMYVAGRSTTLLKVKSFLDDEATVIGYDPGKGRHNGRVGALRCKMSNGTLFSVGTGLSDHDRDNPPAIGSIITFRYQELSDGGVPRFPSFVGVFNGD